MNITFVIPVLNEEATLEALAEGIIRNASPHPYRILFVDDGSTDSSFQVMCRIREKNPNVSVIRLRSHFGKAMALAAGFERADGDLVFTMDSDLQDEPNEIPRFIAKLEEGYDVVTGWKEVRHDPWHKRLPSRIYNWGVGKLFGVPLHDVNCGFKAFRREVIQRLPLYGEMHRLIPVAAHGLGYRVTEIRVTHHARRFGQSKYGVERFTRGASDVLTLWFLSRYMHRPGHFFGVVALVQMLLGLVCLAGGIGAWAIGHWNALGAMLCGVGLVLEGLGVLALCLALVAELFLRHFLQVEPQRYVAEIDGHCTSSTPNGTPPTPSAQ